MGGLGGGNANAAGAGNGAVIGNQAIGTGTGIANAGPGNYIKSIRNCLSHTTPTILHFQII